MNAHVDGRAQGAALRPLKREEITLLILLARSAFNDLVDRGVLGESAEFDVWRHEQCMLVAECAGLTQARREDFPALKAHFLRLVGREQEAEACLRRGECEPRRHAMAKLSQACEAASDVMPGAMNYARGFIRNKRGLELEDADDKSIWHALYTVQRRAKQLRKQRAVARGQFAGGAA